MKGYWKMPEETAAVLLLDGFLRTGDAGYLRPDGYLRFTGRYKDMLKVGGENVDPMEAEGLILEHPAIRQVAIVGLPDERWGQAVTAFVVPARGTDPVAAAEKAMAYARDVLPSLKRPKRVIAVHAIPRSGVGKTLRRTLVAGEFDALGETVRG